MQSETIGKLADALSKAQGQIKGASKDVKNEFFKSKYADLASVWDACRDALSTNGLCVAQTMDGGVESVTVNTTLIHTSGEWISGSLTLKPVKADPQGIGSAATYARRYSLAAMVGVAPEDDDGNAASGKDASSTAWIDGAAKGKTTAPVPTSGALNKTKLTEKFKQICADILASPDLETLSGVEFGYKDVIDQIKTDMPKWWDGEPDGNGAVPLKQRFEARRAILSQPNPMQAG